MANSVSSTELLNDLEQQLFSFIHSDLYQYPDSTPLRTDPISTTSTSIISTLPIETPSKGTCSVDISSNISTSNPPSHTFSTPSSADSLSDQHSATFMPTQTTSQPVDVSSAGLFPSPPQHTSAASPPKTAKSRFLTTLPRTGLMYRKPRQQSASTQTTTSLSLVSSVSDPMNAASKDLSESIVLSSPVNSSAQVQHNPTRQFTSPPRLGTRPLPIPRGYSRFAKYKQNPSTQDL